MTMQRLLFDNVNAAFMITVDGLYPTQYKFILSKISVWKFMTDEQ